MLFQRFNLCSELTDVLAMLFFRAAFGLKTVVLFAQRRGLLFQNLMLGFERGPIISRLSSHV